MKIALPVSTGRVASVFDFAHRLLVIDLDGDQQLSREEVDLVEQQPGARARRLLTLGVQRLICGAISRPLAEQFADAGVDLIPLVSGAVDEVISAYANGELEHARFLMPGCTAEQRKDLKEPRSQEAIAREGGLR
jgi:predicted Fe-Mo cluster-binding NifX family protein